MKRYNPVTGERGECIAVGRGAIAIRLALSIINDKFEYVLVPANICYAAVLPIIYAGYLPVFCDVDENTGNVTIDSIRDSIKGEIGAAILPHMYGNPIQNLPDIVEYLHSINVKVIEDCASLMTRGGIDYIPGTIGDFTVYSTGYSKTIDLGFGGLLFSKKYDVESLERIESGLPPFKQAYKEEWEIFSKVYRVLRNSNENSRIAKIVYDNLGEALRGSYYLSITEEEKTQVFECIDQLDRIVSERKRQHKLYLDALRIPEACYYPFQPDSVPWRFNLLCMEGRKELINYCLKRNLPVSDWYPRVTPIFGDSDRYPGAYRHEKRILNFPLLISDDEIKEICSCVNEFFEKENYI